MKIQTENDILELVESDAWMMKALKTAAQLNLPDWWIGAGFVRNKVWDALHDYKTPTSRNDLDVIYFEPKPSRHEIDIETDLKKKAPEYPWEVVNQATVHLGNNHAPYLNSTDALSYWTETATCIAVSRRNGKTVLTAPHGIEDLTNLIVRFNPKKGALRHVFESRMRSKNWSQIWPKLKFIE